MIGGTGTDTLTGGNGYDTFSFAQGDSTPTVSGSGSSATLSGFDVITDYVTANGSTMGELLSLPGTAVVENDGFVNGPNSIAYSGTLALKSHLVSNGMVTFYGNDTQTGAVTIDTTQKLAAAVDYLKGVDLGNGGETVAFKATLSGVTSTYVYTQTGANKGETGTNNFTVVQLTGVDAAGLTTDSSVTTNKYILID